MKLGMYLIRYRCDEDLDKWMSMKDEYENIKTKRWLGWNLD